MDAFPFDVKPQGHPDGGDAALAVKAFLMSIGNHDVAYVRGALDLAALGGSTRQRDTADALIRRGRLAGVSVRYDEPRFVRSVYRAVSDGWSTVPFFVVLLDSTSADAVTQRRLYFTAFITATGTPGRTVTDFRLDSVSRRTP
jgi:hypothetical protein